MTEPKLFLATKAVIAHNGKILLLKKKKKIHRRHNAGRYDFPGGRLKYDDALLCEVREETRLDVKISNTLCVNEWHSTV